MDYSEIDAAIANSNDRLRLANLGLVIIRRGKKLSLRGMFPSRSGEGKKSQQMLSLDIYANPAGLKRAESEAKKISGLLACKEFNWADYAKKEEEKQDDKTCGDWIAELKADYFAKRAQNPKSETTWGDYMGYLGRLPNDAPLSKELLLEVITDIPADKRSRQYCCIAIGLLVKFAGLDFDVSPYKGTYSAAALSPRDLPSDEEIAEWYGKFKNSGWQYVFGLMACYGLRNHEVFNLDLQSLQKSPGILTVLGGKTGGRRVWPCYPEWWERWELWRIDLLPEVTGQNNSDLGSRVNQGFKREGFRNPYNLRHAWAVRTLSFGWDLSLAADQMGHSVQVHSQIYHHWINEAHHQRAFDLLMNRCDRPMPP
jgi:integrase